ncbi:MAG: TldD/PmbA family protein [Alphaproteobacteria bacterium]|nr:TldD/PmbA family protein [Alphaproteobacteria bacterium]
MAGIDWRAHLEALAARADALRRGDEAYGLYLTAERSDFVRFNRGLVRQPGTVQDAAVTVRWVHGRRHLAATFTLTGDVDGDTDRLGGAIASLRQTLPALPEDPYLLLPVDVVSTEQVGQGTVPDARDVVDEVVDWAQGAEPAHDLVGIYAGGTSVRGFANHLGQRNWFEAPGFVFDLCLVQGADRAVKATLAAPAWDGDAFRAQMAQAAADLAVLARPPKRLTPGDWRAFLTPAAMEEVYDLLCRGGFSANEQHRQRSCLGRLVADEVQLDPRVTLTEHTAGGIAPCFQSDGFVRPDAVALWVGGRHTGAMVSPRTAVELGVPHNGADADEVPQSLHLHGGELPMADARARLGTGVWVSNLWYTNHSDMQSARITGLTRFATLWVEGGEAVAPVEVMRFDDSVYALFGERLEALTTETAFLADTGTYGWRSTRSQRLPGALVAGLTLTL